MIVIIGVDLRRRFMAIEIDDRLEVVPVLEMFDGEGEETDDPSKALAFSAGSDELGFISVAVDIVPHITVH